MNPLVNFVGRQVIAPLVVFFSERLWGWRLANPYPKLPKYMFIAEYHTSNLDTLVLLYTAAKERRRVRFIIKKESQNWFIAGRLLTWAGAIFIDRDAPLQAIKTIMRTVREAETCILLICPSGTRGYTECWQTGFYYLAQKLQLPLVAAAPDFATKTVFIGEPLHPTGDIEADVATLATFFEPITARHPEDATPVRLLPAVQDEKQSKAQAIAL